MCLVSVNNMAECSVHVCRIPAVGCLAGLWLQDLSGMQVCVYVQYMYVCMYVHTYIHTYILIMPCMQAFLNIVLMTFAICKDVYMKKICFVYVQSWSYGPC
jgi:hypothetical protein